MLPNSITHFPIASFNTLTLREDIALLQMALISRTKRKSRTSTDASYLFIIHVRIHWPHPPLKTDIRLGSAQMLVFAAGDLGAGREGAARNNKSPTWNETWDPCGLQLGRPTWYCFESRRKRSLSVGFRRVAKFRIGSRNENYFLKCLQQCVF